MIPRPIVYAVDEDNLNNATDLNKHLNSISAVRPVVVRMANFSDTNLELIARLPRDQPVVWKIEYTGDETPHPLLSAARGMDVDKYVRKVTERMQRLAVYTFTDFNCQRLLDQFGSLRDLSPSIAVVPLAVGPCLRSSSALDQPTDIDGWARDESVWLATTPETVYGACGILSPTKGIHELAEGAAKASSGRIAFALIAPGRNSREVWSAWERRLGRGACRIAVRVGQHGEVQEMERFRHSVDVVLVNSIHDSWGRVVTEAITCGVPVIVRRARCATNFAVPGVTIRERLDVQSDSFDEAVHDAKQSAPSLQEWVSSNLAHKTVAEQFLSELIYPMLSLPETDDVRAALQSPVRIKEMHRALQY